MLWCAAILTLLTASASGRAINISNTWILPEEGFPVFYRYFRDRISWYEADAVCQFHHANLVTVDTTAQYDAVRAYLKELDITNNVWLGLIRSNADGDFTWTDYRGLSGEGYWSSPPDSTLAPLCAAADPVSDYRWTARGCGGPDVASFICELPVPQWALGSGGCMVRALPALTAVYLPESAAVQLTTDCGLAGVKKVLCTGDKKPENIVKELSCGEVEDTESQTNIANTYNTPASWSPNTEEAVIDQNIEYNSGVTTEVETTSHLMETTNNSEYIVVNRTTTHNNLNVNDETTISSEDNITNDAISDKNKVLHELEDTRLNSIASMKGIEMDILLNNNLQSNEIPKMIQSNDLETNKMQDDLEADIHMKSKILHDEMARHGNFETIFTQPTDHFIPPLVMAKAKISNDMKVLSPDEKHAQQVAEHRNIVNRLGLRDFILKDKDIIKSKTEQHSIISKENIDEQTLTLTSSSQEISENSTHGYEARALSTITASPPVTSDISEKVPIKASKGFKPKKFYPEKDNPKKKLSKTHVLPEILYIHKVVDIVTPISSEQTTSISTIEFTTKSPVTSYISTKAAEDATITKSSKYMPNINMQDLISTTALIDDVMKKTYEEELQSNYTVNGYTNAMATSEKLPNEVLSTHINQTFVETKSPDGQTAYSAKEIGLSLKTTEDSFISESIVITTQPITFTVPPVPTTMLRSVTTSISSESSPTRNVATATNKTEPKSESNMTSLNLTHMTGEISYSGKLEETTLSPFTKSASVSNQTWTSTSTANIVETSTEIIIKASNMKENIAILTNNQHKSDTQNRSSNLEDISLEIEIQDGEFNDTEIFESPLLSGANEPIPRPNRSRRLHISHQKNKFNPLRIIG